MTISAAVSATAWLGVDKIGVRAAMQGLVRHGWRMVFLVLLLPSMVFLVLLLPSICRSMGREREVDKTAGNSTDDSIEIITRMLYY